jgi:hypothetical protein
MRWNKIHENQVFLMNILHCKPKTKRNKVFKTF